MTCLFVVPLLGRMSDGALLLLLISLVIMELGFWLENKPKWKRAGKVTIGLALSFPFLAMIALVVRR